jgi:ElaB/YqjD/DUF883 family membrane-anchored ribosome-binding protein
METTKLNAELSQKIQSEVTNMKQALSSLCSDIDTELQQVKRTVEDISDNFLDKINAQIVDTRKGIERVSHKVGTRSKALINELQKYKGDRE